jgi:hypothetical protein
MQPHGCQEKTLSLQASITKINIHSVMGKLFSTAIVAFLTTVPACAQPPVTTSHQVFQHLEVTAPAGTTGLGIELGSYLGERVRVRAGLSAMPHWREDMKFSVQVGDKPESKYDAQGNRVETKFDKLQKRMKELTGYDVDETISMEGVPRYYNFSMLVDVFPFGNRHWHITGGFFWGNKLLADAIVSRDDMTTMLAVGMYDNMYTKAINNDPFVSVNGNDIYNSELADRLISYGRMKYRIGDMKSTGEACYVEPDANGLIKAVAKVNAFKPYIGFGYDGVLSKKDDSWRVGFDAGMMFYGGMPQVLTERTIETVTEDPETGIKTYTYTKEEVDMARDVTNYPKNIKSKMNLLKAMVVFPVLNVKISKRIF